RIWQERADAISATPATLARLARTGGTRPVLVEDADRLAYPEPAFFHLLNRSMREKRAVLMTARALLPAWPYRTEDLLSRVRLAAPFTLATPDDGQLAQILVKLFADRGIRVDARVTEFLVARMERSP